MEDLFKKFTGNDELRPAFSKPCKVDGLVYATDASIIIFTEEGNIDFSEYSSTELNAPNIRGLFKPKIMERELDVKNIDLSFFKTEDEYRVIENEIECSECDGWGEVEWEYSSYTKEFDCPKCEGSGVSSDEVKEPTGNKTFKYDETVTVLNTKIHASYFELIQEAIGAIGGKCIVTYSDRNLIQLTIGDFEIICMSLLVDMPSVISVN